METSLAVTVRRFARLTDESPSEAAVLHCPSKHSVSEPSFPARNLHPAVPGPAQLPGTEPPPGGPRSRPLQRREQHARRRPWLVLSFPPNPSVSPDTEPRLVSTCPVGGPCLWSSSLSGPPVLSRSSGGWILEPGGSVSAADMVTFCFPASQLGPSVLSGEPSGGGSQR